VRGSYFENNRSSDNQLYNFYLPRQGHILDIDNSKINGGRSSIYLGPNVTESDLICGSGNTDW
jgi:hypothetical protein